MNLHKGTSLNLDVDTSVVFPVGISAGSFYFIYLFIYLFILLLLCVNVEFFVP
jgi:hypothetical protein